MEKKFTYKGTEYDSQEEIEFSQWLEEAKIAGLVTAYYYHPITFKLAEAVKFSDHAGTHKLSDVEYTPDFVVEFTYENTYGLPRISEFCPEHGLQIKSIGGKPIIGRAYIDVKGIPGFKKGQTANHSLATYPIKAAWVFQKYGIYINKVVARDMKVKDRQTQIVRVTKPGFFTRTWAPEECAWMKARKVRTRTKAFINCKTMFELPFIKK